MLLIHVHVLLYIFIDLIREDKLYLRNKIKHYFKLCQIG
jgi:hypothetical protein